MTRYKIKIGPEALKDIQEATNWYNKQLQGLGSCFQKQVIVQIRSLKTNPSAYARALRRGALYDRQEIPVHGAFHH